MTATPFHLAEVSQAPNIPTRYTMAACPRCLGSDGHEPTRFASPFEMCHMCGGARGVLIDQYLGTLKKIDLGFDEE